MNYGTNLNSSADWEQDIETVAYSSDETKTRTSFFSGFVVTALTVSVGITVLAFSNKSLLAVITGETTSLSTSTIEGLTVPLAFQAADNEDFVYTFVQKYGLDGSYATDSSVVASFKGSKQWVTVTQYPHGNCEGVEYSVGGVMTATCFALDTGATHDTYNTGMSLMFGCDGDNVIVNRYDGSDCTSFTQALNLTGGICSVASSTAWNDVKIGKVYGVMKCSGLGEGDEYPLYGSYALMKVNVDKKTTMFEAVASDTCIDASWGTKDQSVAIGLDDDNEAYMEYYPSANCEIQEGKNTDRYELSSEETSITGDGDSTVSYSWEWFELTTFSPTPDGFTYAPTESFAPTTTSPTIAESPAPTPTPTEIPTEMPVEIPVATPLVAPLSAPTAAGIPTYTYHPSVPPPVK